MPPSYNFELNDASVDNADFCVVPNGIQNDLTIQVIPINPARPGFDAAYKIIYANRGTSTLSGTIEVLFDDAHTDFVSSDTALQSQSLNTLVWQYPTLLPFQSGEINFTLNLNAPMETPPVNIGDQLNVSATIFPIENDVVPANNQSLLKQTVVGSMDPNDKQVTEGATISPSQTDEFLHYLIRFQNTGTFYAENVVVRDELSQMLDWSTVEIIGASHNFRTSLNQNILEFAFDDIMLPAVGDDEPGSHGFVMFKVKPIAGFSLDQSVSNTANIYFDFNFPIVTNTVTTTVTALSVPEQQSSAFTLFPNPANSRFTVNGNDVNSISIFSITGRLLLQKDFSSGDEIVMDVESLASGTYVVKIKGAALESVKKFIKL
ncbi:MAG: T9SS type A sorting domain-containing protein [Flavobacterium sp.]|uniref:DUF7619 domain-containing protein n=1 Tax=Flavobacterium sp. TaxID=239 RepID=UPI00121F3564|nr:T9SS type A sorting domain-containing protein [Flavobacterium sp.]RZJ66337.1 MAG: T9SS type A sorting domain-containing protein [Flavobacterium sp.]